MKNISVKNITRVYKTTVLDNFSATFEWGKCTALMGESGCGKTTLLNILMGLDKNYTGTVEGMPEKFAVVFQEDRLCGKFSVVSNIKMVMPDGLTGWDGLLAELDMTETADMKVDELSGGQKRRVAIARALMYDAELLIMDEPFKGLDEETKEAVATAIKKRNKTIIMVTHDPEEADLMNADIIKMVSLGTVPTDNF